MTPLIEELIKCSFNKYCFVKYIFDGDNFELEIPFLYKNNFLISKNYIEGFDFITKKNTRLILKNIKGFICAENKSQYKDIKNKINTIKYKKTLLKKLKNTYNISYTYDDKYILYNPSIDSIFMLPFNIKNIDLLNSNQNLNLYTNIYKKFIKKYSKCTKLKLLNIIKKFNNNKDIQIQKSNIIHKINDINKNQKFIADTPIDLIKYNWPKVLAPNPFLTIDFLKK